MKSAITFLNFIFIGCVHNGPPALQESRLAPGSERSMHVESRLLDLFEFKEGFHKLLWNFIQLENLELPEGFSLNQIDDYLKRSLRPVLVPKENGTWEVSKIRESNLSRIKCHGLDRSGQLSEDSFLSELPDKPYQGFRRKAEQHDYQKLSSLYNEMERDHAERFPETVPIVRMRMEGSPVLKSSKGQRILIYDIGGLNVSSFLRFKNQIIGAYQQQLDGSITKHPGSFEIDLISVARAKLLNKHKQELIFDDDVLESTTSDFGLPAIRPIMTTMNKDILCCPGVPFCDKNHIWRVLEILATLNPDAQFVLLFSAVHKENIRNKNAKQGEYTKGVRAGEAIVRLINQYEVNFVNESMSGGEFDPSLGKMDEFKEYGGDEAYPIQGYWELKTIFEKAPETLLFKSLPNSLGFERNIPIFLEMGFKGFESLTEMGLILVSNTNRRLDSPVEGAVLGSVCREEWDLDRLVWSDISSHGVIYTNFEPILRSQNSGEVRWWIPLLVDFAHFFLPFQAKRIDSSHSLDELKKSEAYNATSFATPLVLSYCNWLRQKGLFPTKQSVVDLLSKTNGFPILVDIQKWSQYLGL